MQLTITIGLDGAAFVGDEDEEARPGYKQMRERIYTRREVEKITGTIAAKIEDGEREGTCRDSNGNTCGTWSLS